MGQHAHHHHSGQHDHAHTPHTGGGRRAPLRLALVLTGGFALLEAGGGWWANSLALLSDAGHMVTDASALAIALFAAWLAAKPVSPRHSFGLGRAEVIAALFNSVFMLILVIGIVVSAVQRLRAPAPVEGGIALGVATVGLLINGVVLTVLSRGEQTLNTRSALLHVMGDLLGSLAAIIAGAVVLFTGWYPIDSLLSLLICGVIMLSSVRLLREVVGVIMEVVPAEVQLPAVGQALAGLPGVRSVHDLHIWTLPNGRIALSAHVVVEAMAGWPDLLYAMTQLLQNQFAIEHITLQPEPLSRVVRAIINN